MKDSRFNVLGKERRESEIKAASMKYFETTDMYCNIYAKVSAAERKIRFPRENRERSRSWRARGEKLVAFSRYMRRARALCRVSRQE